MMAKIIYSFWHYVYFNPRATGSAKIVAGVFVAIPLTGDKRVRNCPCTSLGLLKIYTCRQFFFRRDTISYL